jgi:hypothetical protein
VACVPFLVDAGDEEHFVVHRESEHDREGQYWDEGVDRAGLDPERAAQPAAFEHRLGDASEAAIDSRFMAAAPRSDRRS